MAAIEFENRVISLEYYLDNIDHNLFKDHDHLQGIFKTVDPRTQIHLPLSERLHPLTPHDMTELKEKALITPAETIETFSLKNDPDQKFYVGNCPEWYEIYGDYANPIVVKRLNIRMTTGESGDWQLLCLISETVGNPLNHPEEQFDFQIGWVHKNELNNLRQIASDES